MPSCLPTGGGTGVTRDWNTKRTAKNEMTKLTVGRLAPVLDKNLKVTVFLTTYNRPKLVIDAIRSVQLQTWPNWELLVLDDGSTDDTMKEVLHFAYTDKRIRTYFMDHSGNPAVSLDRALHRSTGDYWSWLCDDDLWLPEKLERQLRYLETNRIFGACYSDSYITDQTGIRWQHRSHYNHAASGSLVYDLLRENFIPGGTVMTRAGYMKFNCDPKLREYSDWWTWLDLAAHCMIGYIPFELAVYRYNPLGLGQTLGRNLPKHFEQVAYLLKDVRTSIPLIGQNPTFARRSYECELAARSDRFWSQFPAPVRYPFAYLSRMAAGLYGRVMGSYGGTVVSTEN
jgi:glycosyltransferase involved in cell wall biosynthesis